MKMNRGFGETYRLHFRVEEQAEHETSVKASGRLYSGFFFLFGLFLTPNMGATFSSKTSVDFQRTTRR
jgi:hypothetical protein